MSRTVPLIQQLDKVLQLHPGQNTTFLHTEVLFLEDAKSWPEQYPLDPSKTYFSGITEPCRWSISEKYFKEAMAAADFTIVAVCCAGPYCGVKAFATGYRDKHDLNGVYVSLSCNSEIADQDENFLKLRLGQILKVALLNYAYSLGLKHAYNHASNSKLLPFHRRNGWLLSNEVCGKEDPIAKEFADMPAANIDAYLAELKSSGRLVETGSGYPMRLCEFNIALMIDEVREHVESLLPHIHADPSVYCNFT